MKISTVSLAAPLDQTPLYMAQHCQGLPLITSCNAPLARAAGGLRGIFKASVGMVFALLAVTLPAWGQSARFLGAQAPGLTDSGIAGPVAAATSATPSATSIGFNPADAGTATPQKLVASFAISGYTGSLTPTAAMHYGHDYTVGAADCTTHTGTTETCTFAITFKPTLPGTRKDAIVVSNGGSALATVLVYGNGKAPLSALNPGVETQVATPQYSYGATVDENGTAYVFNSIANAIYSYTKDGVLSTLPITGLSSPHGIAIDGAGTLYIAQNTYSHQIITYTADGTQGALTVDPPAPYVPCSNSNGGSLEYLYSVAVDGGGNVFALELLCNQILELKADGTYAETTIDPAMIQPSNITVDDLGNIFLSGYKINELTAGGTQTQINATGAGDIAVDASGILYAAGYPVTHNGISYGVAELPPSDYTTPVLGLEPGNALGLGLGSDGALFVGDSTNIDVIDRSQGVMAFGQQTGGVGSTPQIVEVVNIGNQPLSFSNVALVDAPGYALRNGGADCKQGTVLGPAAHCAIVGTLTPTHAGTWNGSIVIKSDSLNEASSMQTVALTGSVSGVYVTAAPSSLTFGPQTAGTTSTPQMVTLTNNGASSAAAIETPSSSDGAFTAGLGTCTASVPPGGSCQLAVTFTPGAATTYSATISVVAASSDGGPSQTVTFAASGSGVILSTTTLLSASATTAAAGGTITLSATVSSTSSAVVPTGTVSFNDGATVLGTGTLDGTGNATYATTALAAGFHSITAAYGGSSENSASTSAALNVLITDTASALQFIPVTPCRVADTRNATGTFGGPELGAGTAREFDIPSSACGIPSSAVAYSLNVTVVPDASLNYLTLWPRGQTQPNVSTLNSDGRVKANAAITPAGTSGGVSLFVSDATQVVLDIDGYFVRAGTPSALAFFPVTPCRIADTRGPAGALGGPFLSGGGGGRSFPIRSSSCGLPVNAQAYSLNITAVPHSTLSYLTTWPTGETQPNASTLNSPTGAVTANAAIVPAGSGGDVSLFVSDDADVILDVNGYFAPPAAGALSLYTSTPCRVIDTRPSAFIGVLTVDVQTSVCAPPATAQAYVLNSTVVPPGPLNYVSLWPDGQSQPGVSTLNADDGAITSNMAIVPTVDGSIDAFAFDSTNLILDVSSYFAP